MAVRVTLLGLVLLCSAADGAPGWRVNAAAFELSATMTAVLYVNGEAQAEENLVGVFVDDQCRGVAAPIRVLDSWMYFITVYANSNGESISPKAYLAAADTVVDIAASAVFTANQAYGDPTRPYELHVNLKLDPPTHTSGIPDAGDDIPGKFRLGETYPNPFAGSTRAGYDMPTAARLEMSVFNHLGQRVRTLLSADQPAGRWDISWDGCDDEGGLLPSGVYLLAARVNGSQLVRKAVLVR
jgi:hypothetical protein